MIGNNIAGEENNVLGSIIYQWLETIDWTDSFQQSTRVTSVTQWCERKPITDLFQDLWVANSQHFFF